LELHRADGCWLVAAAGGSPGLSGALTSRGWIVWLADPRRASWSEGEASALALAGQALWRWLDAEAQGPRWAATLDRADRQQRLEIAAQVTRRLAHDFGNVLTGILGFSELALAQQVPANTPLHVYLHEVYRSALNGAQFTQQLRLFSRRQAACSRPGHLRAVLQEQEARLQSACEAGLHLHIAVPADLPPCALDGEPLGCVLGALLDNAREALTGPGSVSVSARVVELSAVDCLDLFGSTRPGR
jgi:signal transduction histidine kinase